VVKEKLELMMAVSGAPPASRLLRTVALSSFQTPPERDHARIHADKGLFFVSRNSEPALMCRVCWRGQLEKQILEKGGQLPTIEG